jgi:hypothetical protein
MSARDVQAGAIWSETLRNRLATTHVGIVCLTPENLDSTWILFEAGALAKSVDGRVLPVLLDLEPTDVKEPLSQFQSAVLSRDGMKSLVKSLNEYSPAENTVLKEVIDEAFDLLWPKLEALLRATPPAPTGRSGTHRTDRQLLEEIVQHSRRLTRTGEYAEPPTITEMIEALNARLKLLEKQEEVYSIAEYGSERAGHDVPEGLRTALERTYEEIPKYQAAVDSLRAILEWSLERSK